MSEAMTPYTNGGSITAATYRDHMGLAETLSRSSLIPAPLRGKPGDVLIILMTGNELGLAPMQALRSIYVVDGKPTLSADLAAALVLKSPVCEQFRMTEQTDDHVTYVAQRHGQEPVTVRYTIADATAARLTNKQNWQQHRKAMLRARCAMAAARAVFPDLFMGLYDPDELDQPIREPVKGKVVETPPPATLDDVVKQAHADASKTIEDRMPPIEAPADPADPEETPAAKATALCLSITAIENVHHWRNWKKAHGKEVNALPKAEKKRVVDAYEQRGKDLEPEFDGPEPPDGALESDK